MFRREGTFDPALTKGFTAPQELATENLKAHRALLTSGAAVQGLAMLQGRGRAFAERRRPPSRTQQGRGELTYPAPANVDAPLLRRYALEKRPVMADEKDAAGTVPQGVLKGLNGWKIQMVGWLVQHEESRRPHHPTGQDQLAYLSGTRRFGLKQPLRA